MTFPGKFNKTFKIISACVAGIFLFQQVAWAGDFLGRAIERQQREQSQTFGPSYIQGRHDLHESLIKRNQDAEDFSRLAGRPADLPKGRLGVPSKELLAEDGKLSLRGPRGGRGDSDKQVMSEGASESLLAASEASSGDNSIISITTSTGDIIRYQGGAIYEIEKEDGTIIRDIELDENNNLLKAEIGFSDGTIETVMDGRVCYIQTPLGGWLSYDNNGLLVFEGKPDGGSAFYSYEKDGDGNILRTIVQDFPFGPAQPPLKVSYYDSDNKLERVEFASGKVIEYIDGMLSKVSDVDGLTYAYESMLTAGDDVLYAVTLSEMQDDEGNIFRLDNNNIVEAEISGVIYHYKSFAPCDFNRDGKTDDADASILAANWGTQDAAYIPGDANGDGKVDTIDASILAANWGKTSYVSGENTILYNMSGDAALVVYADGSKTPVTGENLPFDIDSILPEGLFSSGGKLNIGYDFTNLPYFDKIAYSEDGTVSGITKPDGSIVSYYEDGPEAGLIKEILGSDGLSSYNYALTATNNIGAFTVERLGIKRIYDEYGNLEKVSLDDATEIIYENGLVKEITKADGTTIKNMTFSESGELDSALISYPDGSMAVYEDANLIQIIAASGDIDYEDGKIRHITSDDGSEYDWAYNTDGSIVITDMSRQEKRTYSEGKLIALEELSGAFLATNYYYDTTSGDLVKSEVCKSGDVLYTYTYEYKDDLTLIHDEDSNTQAYNSDKKLTYIIDSTGKEYSYTYVGKNEGLIEVYFPSGVKVRYDTDGNVVDVTKDSTIISNITFDESNNLIDFTYVKDNVTYKVVGGSISEAIAEGGTTLYYDNGFVESVQDMLSGDIEEYQYYVTDSKAYKDVSFFQSGSANNVSYFINNSTAKLTLSSNDLEFGDGSDGIKHVTFNETLPAGTYNFTNLIIDPGKTLALQNGTTIKCLDTLDIKGTISGSDVNISASTITVEEGASIVGLSQSIYANVINNAGSLCNLCHVSETTLNASGYSFIATPRYACDENMDSFSGYYYRERGGDGYFYNGAWSTWTWTFPIPQDISTLAWKLYCYAQTWAGASENSGAWGVYMTVTHSGGTSVLVNGSGSGAGNWCGGYSQNNNLVEDATGWAGVTQVQVKLYGKAKRVDDGAGGGNEDIYHYIYELKADGADISYLSSTGDVPISKERLCSSPGTFRSGILELDPLTLDTLSWYQDLPSGTAVSIKARTGDTIDPDAVDSGWTTWSDPMTDSSGSLMTTAKSKYVQFEISLFTTDTHLTPTLNLSGVSPLEIGYKRAPIDESEAEDISFITRKENDITHGYNKNGLLIWTEDADGNRTMYDPPDTTDPIYPSKLVFDCAYVDGLKSLLPKLILNDTQKAIYMKDNIIVSELTAINNADGSRAEYTQGALSKITMSDGVVIADIVFDEYNKAKDFTYTKDGTTYIVKDRAVSEVIAPDGTRTKYYPYGFKESAEDSLSRVEYDYGIDADNIYTTISTFQSGTHNSTSFYTEGGVTYLELSANSLQFGDGTDGVKHVTANEVLEAGTYNFASLIIDTGVTLTVNAGAVINCLGAIDVNGAMICQGTLEINAYTLNVGSSGKIAGSADIKTDTFNNNGIITSDMVWLGSITSEYVRDGNTVTAYGDSYNGGYQGPNRSSTITCYAAWDTPVNLSRLQYMIDTRASEKSSSCSWSVQLYYGGAWHSVDSGSASGWNPVSSTGGLKTITGDWTGVTAIMCTAYGSGSQDVPYYSLQIYEMKAYAGSSDVTIGYVNGNPGTVNSGTATKQQNIYSLEGSFESDVMEVDALTFDDISWTQNLPEGTHVTIQTRTGNTLDPDDDDSDWTEWSEAVSDCDGSKITSDFGKYLQYRINLSTDDLTITPKVALDNSNPLTISYTKFPDLLTDSYVKVKEGGITKAYNKDGVIIWEEDILGNRTTYDLATPHEVIDLATLKFDSTYTDTLIENLPASKLGDAQKVITIYDEGNDVPVEIVSADQSITYFEEGFATKVVDKNGIIQVQYTYDDDHNILKVEFVDARAKLEENYQKALLGIVTQTEEALAKLDRTEADSIADISEKAADLQMQIDDERAMLARQKEQYDASVYDLSGFDAAFAQLDDYETQLNKQIADAYLDIAVQVAAAKAKVSADASTAMQKLINDDYNKILIDIAQKESSVILYQYYRKVLGRDPGDDELLYWMDTIKAQAIADVKSDIRPIDPGELTAYIEALSEYADRDMRKGDIINTLTTFFADYLTKTDPEKESIAASLGLSPDELTNLTEDNINSITAWLTGQSLHFGDSAFQTVIELLEENGITFADKNTAFEAVGIEAIKVDILTGVITKDTTGDLIISMYAMRKAANLNGLTLYSQKINYDDLKEQLAEGSVIIHIDGKHYVVVTAVDDENGTVTYMDTTVGKEGQSITISRSELMEVWKGYALSKELSYDKELPGNPSKEINATVEKNIRGSSWLSKLWRSIVEFFQKIIAPIATVLLFIPPLAPLAAVALGINIIVQTISFVVHTGTLMDVVWSVVNSIGAALGATILPGIYEAAGSIFSQISHSMSAWFQGAFSSVMPIFNTIASAVKGIATGIGQIVTLGINSDIAATIGYNIIAQGISLGSDFLFKSLNLDPTWASIGSALLTGAVMGMMTPDTNIVAEALKYGTIAGVEELGEAADLDPNITYLSAMLAGSLVGGALDIGGYHLTYDQIMDDIALEVGCECINIGITEFGDMVGLDPRVSYIAGVGIRTSLYSGYMRDPVTGEWRFDADRMWRGAIDGLTDPITLSIAFSVAGDAIGLDPLYNSIIINLAAGAIEGSLENPQNVIYGMFRGAFDNFIESSVRALTFGLYDPGAGGWNNDYQSQYWLTHLVTFVVTIQQEGGIVEALTKYMSTVFRDDAIRSINEVGGIADFLTGRAEIVYEDGVAKKKVSFTDNYSLYLDPNTDEVIGRDYGDIQERGHYGINPLTGGFGLIDGTILEAGENGTMVYHVRGSLIIDRIDFLGTGRNYSIIAMNPEIGLQLDEYGLPTNGIVEDIDGTQLFEYEYINDAMFMKLNIQSPNITGGTVSINLSNISDAEKQDIINYYMLANGINNMNPYGSPGYMDGFSIDLANADPAAEDFTFIPLFNEFYGKISPATFEKIYQNQLYAIAIYEDLKTHGYVDQDGKILPSFLEVKSSADFIMSSQFSEIKDDIYQVLWSACQHAAEDVVKWLEDVHGDSDEITNKIIDDIKAIKEKNGGVYPNDMVGFCYSGAGDPFIQAINQQIFDGAYLDIEALILVGTPLKKDFNLGLWNNRTIVNPSLHTVITIEGEKDIFHPTDHSFDSSLFVKNENQFRIIIEDAGHTDYFYDPNRPSANDAFKMKISRFIAEVTARSKDSLQLTYFLDRPGISQINGKYVVDINEVTYD